MSSAAIFLDSSALVKLYVAETGSVWVKEVIQAADIVHAVRITAVEIVSALARARRAQRITAEEASGTMAKVPNEFEENCEVTEVSPSLISFAMRLADMHSLRAFDAVQLAGALLVHEHRRLKELSPLLFLSSDLTLNAAARLEGLTVDDPSQHASV